MRPIYSIIVFLCFCAASAVTGYNGYSHTENRLRDELNTALVRAIADRGGAVAALDTVKACCRLAEATSGPVMVNASDETVRRHVRSIRLRSKTYVVCSIGGETLRQESGIHSDTIYIGLNGRQMAIRSYAGFSGWEVLGMSDQRHTLCLLVAALMWLTASMTYLRRRRLSVTDGRCVDYDVQSISLDTVGLCFSTDGHNQVPLTPMQCRLMQLFLSTPGHRLTKDSICRELWPKKDNADETLYTLIRRLRIVLHRQGHLTIETGRGGTYELKSRV